MYGKEGTPRHILHLHKPPNFTKLVQCVVKFSNEVIKKDSVLGGVLSGLSIRPDAQENLILLLALLISQPQLKALHESRSLRTLCSTKSLIERFPLSVLMR